MDYVFCYGVIQHTKNPFETLAILINQLKKHGKLSVDFYRKSYFPNSFSTPKYLWRLFTPKMNKKTLYRIIKFYIPIYLPVDTLIKTIFGSRIGNFICGLIPLPIYNYYFFPLSKKIKTQWAILDTFDALSAKYDYPFFKREIRCMLKKIDKNNNFKYNLFYGSNGIVLNLLKFPKKNGY
jgi:hypothetical protein